MQRRGSSLLQQQRQPDGGRTAQQRQQEQQEAAAAHARELLQGGADVGRSRLSHPLYVPLYEASTLQDVLQQQQQQQQFISRYSSRPTAYDQSADGRLLEDILNMCPLLTPAATLVETKLSSRALRLDTMQMPRSVGGEGAAGAADPSSSSSSAEATGGRQARRRRPLKLSRTKAKKLGLFDVRSDFEAPPSSHSSSSRAAVPPRAAAVRAASPAAAVVTRSHPADMPSGAAAAVGEETQTLRRPAAGVPAAARVSPPPGAAAGTGGGGAAAGAGGGRGAAAGACVASVGWKLCYEDMEQLSAMWLQYARRVCGTAAAGESAAAAPSESSSRTRGSSSDASQQREPHHHHHHQPLQRPLHPRERQQQEGLGRMHLQQEVAEQQQQFFRKAADRCMALSKAAWQGARVCVMRSTSPTLVGLEGVVVEETQHSLLLLCPDQRLRRLLKHTVTLKVQTLDGSNFFIHPQHLQHSSAARSKVKFKPKNSLLL